MGFGLVFCVAGVSRDFYSYLSGFQGNTVIIVTLETHYLNRH